MHCRWKDEPRNCENNAKRKRMPKRLPAEKENQIVNHSNLLPISADVILHRILSRQFRSLHFGDDIDVTVVDELFRNGEIPLPVLVLRDALWLDEAGSQTHSHLALGGDLVLFEKSAPYLHELLAQTSLL